MFLGIFRAPRLGDCRLPGDDSPAPADAVGMAKSADGVSDLRPDLCAPGRGAGRLGLYLRELCILIPNRFTPASAHGHVYFPAWRQWKRRVFRFTGRSIATRIPARYRGVGKPCSWKARIRCCTVTRRSLFRGDRAGALATAQRRKPGASLVC